MIKDYYSILEIKRGITPLEIKRAYRKLMLKWHPDKNNNYQEAVTISQEIQEAYEKINDGQNKYNYNNECLYEINLNNIKFERYKIEMIIKIKKEIDLIPKSLKKDDIKKKIIYYDNFKQKINNYDIKDKNLCLKFVEELINNIKNECKNHELLLIKQKQLYTFKENFTDFEGETLEVDIDEILNIFTNKCSCYLSNNFINVYEDHVIKCLLTENEVQIFLLGLTNIFSNKIKKIRLAITNEIEEEILKYNKSFNEEFKIPIDLINWKENIQNSNRKNCFLIKDSLLKEIEKIKKNKNKIKNNDGNAKIMSKDQYFMLAKILKIDNNDFDFEKLKLNIIKLKNENLEYKKRELNNNKTNLKDKIFKNREKVKRIKQDLCEKDNFLNKKQKDILNKFLYISQKKMVDGIYYNNLYEKNINELKKKIEGDCIKKIVDIQYIIIKMERELFNLIEKEKEVSNN